MKVEANAADEQPQDNLLAKPAIVKRKTSSMQILSTEKLKDIEPSRQKEDGAVMTDVSHNSVEGTSQRELIGNDKSEDMITYKKKGGNKVHPQNPRKSEASS